jgi:methionyl-tRNA formyltransferase
MTPLRIIFLGTAELSCASLEKLVGAPASSTARLKEDTQRAGSETGAPFSVVAVVTQPDKPKGRDLKLTPSPVKVLAEKFQLPVLQPLKARDEKFISELRALQPDLLVVVAYGQILPQTLLDVPQFGCVNIHTSLLPKYRGAAPIQWAIADGETETGVTIMKMDAGLDTGPILSTRRTPIFPTDNSQILHDRLAQLGADLLVETIPFFVAGKITPQPQPAEGSTYAAKIKKEDAHIDWKQPAQKIWNRLRAFTPWPGAFTFFRSAGLRHGSLMAAAPPRAGPEAGAPVLLKILRAEVFEMTGEPGTILSSEKTGIVVACGENSLRILELQREGGKRLVAADFLSGFPLAPGGKLD